MSDTLNNDIDGITILICTYNGAERLPGTLQCLLEQKGDENIPWEVILVDNASNDNPRQVAEKIWTHDRVPLHFLHEPRPGKTNAIESGFNLSKYEIVCIIDDDNRVFDDYIVKIFDVMKNHPEVGICGAQGIGDFEVSPPGWFEKYKDAFAIGPQAPQTGYVSKDLGYIYGGGSAIRKSAWIALCNNHFRFLIKDLSIKHAIIRGEDSEMSVAFLLMGYKLWYQDDILFKHLMPAGRINWKYLKKLFFSFGMSDVIIDFYFLFMGIHSRKRNIRLSSFWINTIYSLIILIKLIPGYFIDLIFVGEGSDRILQYHRIRGYVMQLLSMRKNHQSAILEIKNATWRKEV